MRAASARWRPATAIHPPRDGAAVGRCPRAWRRRPRRAGRRRPARGRRSRRCATLRRAGRERPAAGAAVAGPTDAPGGPRAGGGRHLRPSASGGAPVADPDRPRRGGQDAAGPGRRRRAGRRASPTGCASSTWRRWPTPALVTPTSPGRWGSGESAESRWLAALDALRRATKLLLLLDNCEHLLPAVAALVGDLLAACPRLAVLATSRERLRLRGEHELPVAAAGAARAGSAPTRVASRGWRGRRRCGCSSSGREAVEPGFALTRRQRRQRWPRSARRLDGLPLAIELAAARVKLLPPRGAAGAAGAAAAAADRRAARPARPPADAARRHRLELRPALARASRPVPAAGGLRRRVHAGGGRGRRGALCSGERRAGGGAALRGAAAGGLEGAAARGLRGDEGGEEHDRIPGPSPVSSSPLQRSDPPHLPFSPLTKRPSTSSLASARSSTRAFSGGRVSPTGANRGSGCWRPSASSAGAAAGERPGGGDARPARGVVPGAGGAGRCRPLRRPRPGASSRPAGGGVGQPAGGRGLAHPRRRRRCRGRAGRGHRVVLVRAWPPRRGALAAGAGARAARGRAARRPGPGPGRAELASTFQHDFRAP